MYNIVYSMIKNVFLLCKQYIIGNAFIFKCISFDIFIEYKFLNWNSIWRDMNF